MTITQTDKQTDRQTDGHKDPTQRQYVRRSGPHINELHVTTAKT